MRRLRKEVEIVAGRELLRANEMYPPFASNHEGVGIIDEEIGEAERELERIEKYFKGLKSAVYNDDTNSINVFSTYIKRAATLGACELIQVAAMMQKFEDSRRMRKHGWEEADKPKEV